MNIINQTHQIGPSKIPSFSKEGAPSLFSIVHKTHYKYTKPISSSKHLFRLQPVHDLSQTVLSYQLTLSSKPSQICNFTGAFGNHASFVEINEPYSELHLISRSIVSVTELEKNQHLIHQSRTMPLIWMPWDQVMMEAYLLAPELPESELFELANFAISFVKKNQNDALSVVSDINQTIYTTFTYESGTSSLFTTPYEVFSSQRGVCQDFANLLICLCRLLNIPARYRVGYIYTGGNYENKIQSEASHAWVEVFLPYLGWIGFDPTNGCLAEKNHIRVATGRHYIDATPTSGTLLSAEEGVIEELTSFVRVEIVDKWQ